MQDDEQHRHRCEVRQILHWRRVHGSDWAKGYFEKHKRRDSLEPDVREQWQRGNRGKPGEWIEG